jgi:hypothetical protein
MESLHSRHLDAEPHEEVVSVYRYILDAFPRLGRAPTVVEMKQDLDLAENSIADALRALERYDALRLDPATSWLADAYPYSANQTRHEVVFESGTRVYCMCAIDCLYVPFLTGSDIAIYSSCHVCGAGIEITITGQAVSAILPPTTVVWDSDAAYDCPKTNFFCCEEHLEEWRGRARDEPGKVCSIVRALERGRTAAVRIKRTVGMGSGRFPR